MFNVMLINTSGLLNEIKKLFFEKTNRMISNFKGVKTGINVMQLNRLNSSNNLDENKVLIFNINKHHIINNKPIPALVKLRNYKK